MKKAAKFSRRKHFLAYAALLYLLLSGHAVAYDKITLLTAYVPPYVLSSGDNGIAIDIAKELFEQTNINYTIESYPLARAIKLAEITPGFCVIPIQRSQERETKFKWVSPVVVSHSAFFTLADDSYSLSVLSDARDELVGVLRGSAQEEYLRTTKIPFRVDEASSELQNLKKLTKRRIKIWATDAIMAPYYAEQEGVKIKRQFIFQSTLRGLACHISTPDSVIDLLTERLKLLYKNGRIKEIFFSYTNKLDLEHLSDFLN